MIVWKTSHVADTLGSWRYFNVVCRHKSIRLSWPGLAMSSSHFCPSQVASHKSWRLQSGSSQQLTPPQKVCSPKHKVVIGFVARPSWGLAKFVHGTYPYPACEALAGSPQNSCGDSWVPYPPRSLLAGVWNYLWPVLYDQTPWSLERAVFVTYM